MAFDNGRNGRGRLRKKKKCGEEKWGRRRIISYLSVEKKLGPLNIPLLGITLKSLDRGSMGISSIMA